MVKNTSNQNINIGSEPFLNMLDPPNFRSVSVKFRGFEYKLHFLIISFIP